MLKRMSLMARTLSSLTAVTECSGHNSARTNTVRRRRIGWLGGANVPVVVGMLMYASVGFAQVFPGTTWEFRTPTQVGVDGAKLDQFATNVGGNGCIVYNGYMIKTWGSQTSKADWASAAKPVISTMLFFAVKENKLSSVDALIGDWNWSLVTKDQPMTFRHLANMTGNYTRSEAPGTAWAYNDYAIQLYQKTLFDRVYGTTPNTAATHSSRLGALQFQDGTLFSSRNGYGVYTSVRDFARIGWFWLNKGNWNGNQLLPASYFDTYRQPGVPGNLPRTCSSCSTSDYLGIGTSGGGSDQTPYGPGIYGFNWWFNNVGGVHPASLTWPDAPLDTYQANGHWNTEVVTVIPSLNLVVSAIGNWGSFEPGNPSSSMNLNLKLLAEAVTDIQPPSVPTNVQAAAHSSSSISLTWTASTDNIGVLGYKIYRNGGGQPVGTTVNTSYIDTGLLPETTYSYTVSAYDAADNHSAQSSPAAVATTQVMPQYCSVDLGATDVENLLSHIAITGGDGDTTWATVGGLECRRPVDTGDQYFYFNINDYYMYDESGTTRYLEVRYFDDQPSSVFLRPQYDSTSAAYTNASEVYFTNTGKWRTATWTLTNCKFANRQNLGADIRLFFGANDVKIDMVRLSTAPFPTPALGQIVVDHDNPAWFRYYGGGPFYMCGPGDPEGFLYRGTRNSDGTRNGDQMTLINKLIGTGANCIYLMAIRSHGGDGGSTENPYINSNLSAGLSDPILNQWETWFTAMDNNGITIFFIFYDDDAKPFGRELPAGGELLPAETVFIDTMVSRFKHHKHLIWCIAEEYIEGLSGARAVKVAQRIRAQDDRQHPIAIHQNESTAFDFNGSPYFDQFAVQWNKNTVTELHSGAVAAWNNVGGLVNINMAEFMDSSYQYPFAGTGSALRQKNWAIAMGGGYAMDIGMDIASTPVADLQDCGRLVSFMEATRFNETVPRDDLKRTDTLYVLADPGNVYLAYGLNATGLSLLVQGGTYQVLWYNPITGAWVNSGTQTVPTGEYRFNKPSGVGTELALYLATADTQPPSVPTNVQAAALSSSSISITWTASTDNYGVVGYEIYRDGGSQPIGTSATTSYTDTALSPSTSYSYTVSAYDAANNSSALSSPPAVATTEAVFDYCSVDLGSTNVENMLSHLYHPSGESATTSTVADGLDCRVPIVSGTQFFYFAVDDTFLCDEAGVTTYLEVCYYDDQSSSVFLCPQYDSTSAAYTDASDVYFTNSGKWKTATWTLPNCKFANRQNLGADFRILVGAYSVKIDSVRLSAIPFTSHTTVERTLGTSEIYKGLSHPLVGDGMTVPVTIGGRECRKPTGSSSYYFYFNVSDAIIYNGNPSTVYLKVEYYDSASGVITPQYDSTGGAYTDATALNLTGTNTWQEAYWTLTNVRFANSQNGSADFRFWVGTAQNVHIGDVVVSKLPFVEDTEPPSVPTNVQAVAQSASSIQITWTASTDNIGVAGYRIYRDGGGQPIGTSATTSYTDTGLSPSTSYSYRVSAYDASQNESAQSTPAAVAITQAVAQENWYCSIDLGATNVENRLSHLYLSSGESATTDTLADQLSCRVPIVSGTQYFYFAIDDTFLNDEAGVTTYLEVCYYDDQSSSVFLRPQYDSTSAAFTDASDVYFTNSGKWKTATWTLPNCKFANRQNLGADFRILVGAYSVKINSVRVSTEPFTSYVTAERDLGTNEAYHGLALHGVQGTEASTIVVNHAGRSCRRCDGSGAYYFYFNVSDAIIYNGDPSTVYLKVEYYDSASGVITPQYDSTGGTYTNATALNLTGTSTWKEAYWTLPNARFANNQNLSCDFRLWVGTGQNVHIDKVVVSRVPLVSDPIDEPPPAEGAPVLLSAVSVMDHGVAGEYALDINLAAPYSVEPRVGGDHRLELVFDQSIDIEDATVTLSSGSIVLLDLATTHETGDTLVVVLGSAPENNACLTIEVDGVFAFSGDSEIEPITLHLGMVQGDVDSGGRVDIRDLGSIKTMLFEPVTTATFLHDVNADGSINIMDVSASKNNLFGSVACP